MNLHTGQVNAFASTALMLAMGTAILGSMSEIHAAEDPPYLEGKLVYKEADGKKLRMEWTKPRDWKVGDKRPAIVFFHGGGWVSGKPGQFLEHSRELAGHGVVCIRVQYRLLDRKSNAPPKTCTEDARDAFAYIHDHADSLGIDPTRIATAGGSAGGHLAAYLGTVDVVQEGAGDRPPKPNAMLLFNPVYDNGPGGWGTGRVGNAYPQYSPMHNISEDDPPTIVFLGTNDKLIPVGTAKSFQAKMQSLGIHSELHLYEGQPHGFFNHDRDGGKWYRATMQESTKFLRKLGWID